MKNPKIIMNIMVVDGYDGKKGLALPEISHPQYREMKFHPVS